MKDNKQSGASKPVKPVPGKLAQTKPAPARPGQGKPPQGKSQKKKTLADRETPEQRKKREQIALDFYQNEKVPKYSKQNMPFFILGAPRSGTTLLRDLLRDHPRLECPEETHFFRWADPFASPKYINHYNTKLFKLHRQMDGISDLAFSLSMTAMHSREHLAYDYGVAYLRGIGKPDARLYDKTPQNVYGIFLINAIYPEAKFIHIYRNPLNVVASLMEGKVMPVHNLRGAINSWTESMMLLDQFKKFKPELLLEVCYEDMTADPDPYLKKILEFVNEDPGLLPSQRSKTHKEKNKYKSKLSQQEIDIVLEKCEPYLSLYGYGGEKNKKEKSGGLLDRLFKRSN